MRWLGRAPCCPLREGECRVLALPLLRAFLVLATKEELTKQPSLPCDMPKGRQVVMIVAV